MTEILMTTWDGGGTTPPMMSVAKALVARGHHVRVMADPGLRPDVEATGAEHIGWTRAPIREVPGRDGDFIRDWEAGPEGFAQMRDRLAVGPAALFAADIREELERRPADCVLTELLLFGAQVAAEGAGVPCVVLNPTINVVPAPGVPPFGQGFLPAETDEDNERDRVALEFGIAVWDEALPALNAARAQQGLESLEHVLDQYRSAALILVMTSAAFDFMGELPPTVKYVGPRLDDPSWAESWTPPSGEEPLVLAGLSSDYQNQEDLLKRIVAALDALPVRGLVTIGKGLNPSEIAGTDNVQVVASAPHAEVLLEAAAVVTHCGHGTTIKALAAGVPVVCVPMGRDQLDVAARVEHRGAGIRLDSSAEPGAIAEAVRAVVAEPGYRKAARRIAGAIAEETADDRVVAEVEALVGEPSAVAIAE